MNQHQLARSAQGTRRIGTAAASYALWLISVVMAVMCIFALREVIIWGLATALTRPDMILADRMQAANMVNLASQCGIIILGIVALGVILYTSEKVFRGAGQTQLMNRLVLLIVVESIIVLPVALIFW